MRHAPLRAAAVGGASGSVQLRRGKRQSTARTARTARAHARVRSARGPHARVQCARARVKTVKTVGAGVEAGANRRENRENRPIVEILKT